MTLQIIIGFKINIDFIYKFLNRIFFLLIPVKINKIKDTYLQDTVPAHSSNKNITNIAKELLETYQITGINYAFC